MRNHLFLIALCLLFSLLISCGKEKPEPYEPVVHEQYHFHALQNFSAYRLFTKAGEITDHVLVQQYVDEFPSYFYSANSLFTVPQFQQFAKVNNDSLINAGTVPAGEVKRIQTNTDYDMYAGKGLLPVNDTGNFKHHIIRYKTVQEQNANGIVYFTNPHPLYFARLVNDYLYFPYSRLITISRTSFSVSFGSDYFNNVFSPSGANRLGDKDTLLIQSFEIVLKKQ